MAKKSIGIPYAAQHVRRGRIYCTCPKCGLSIALTERKDAESSTGREYAEHYAATHAANEEG
jgi:hypothetical protein